MSDKAIKALIDKDHLKVCDLSDYVCGICEFYTQADGGYCGSNRCKDKLLQDVLNMGEDYEKR